MERSYCDDTIEEKPHTDENQIVSCHFDPSKNRTLKGINILNRVCHAQGITLPVAHGIIRKPMAFEDENTGATVETGGTFPSLYGALGRPSNQPKR